MISSPEQENNKLFNPNAKSISPASSIQASGFDIMLATERPPIEVCAPLLPKNNAMISPNPWQKNLLLSASIMPLLPNP